MKSDIVLLHITERKSEIEIFCFQLNLRFNTTSLVKTNKFSIPTDIAVTKPSIKNPNTSVGTTAGSYNKN